MDIWNFVVKRAPVQYLKPFHGLTLFGISLERRKATLGSSDLRRYPRRLSSRGPPSEDKTLVYIYI